MQKKALPRAWFVLLIVAIAATAVALWHGMNTGNTSLFSAGIWATLSVIGFLRLPGKPRWVQVLLCWGATLCLYIALSHTEDAYHPPHPYMGNMSGFLALFILPPVLVLEALGIWFLGSLRRNAARAAALHRQFLSAVEAGDVTAVNQLLPLVHPDDADERGETALQTAVLAATDPIHLPQGEPMAVVYLLLQNGASAKGCLDAMVEQHELDFEATDPQSAVYQAAVQRATELIPQLAAAGDTIGSAALDSARYNCDPAIQRVLAQVKQTPPELPEE